MDGGSVDCDAFGDELQVRTGGAPGPAVEGTQQGIDHPDYGGLSVRSGDLDRGEAPLGVAEQIHQPGHPVECGVDLRLGPAQVEFGLDGREVGEVLRGDRVIRRGIRRGVDVDGQDEASLVDAELTGLRRGCGVGRGVAGPGALEAGAGGVDGVGHVYPSSFSRRVMRSTSSAATRCRSRILSTTASGAFARKFSLPSFFPVVSSSF